MKKLFIAVLSMAALASCAQEDVVYNNDNNAIKFDNAFVGNTTKAVDPSITTSTIQDFQVWGTTQGDHSVDAPIVPIFTNETVSVNTGVWTYDVNKTQYWIDGNTYNFVAIKNAKSVALNDATHLPEDITYTANDTTDLLYATASNIEGKATGNSKVAFTFSHLLSKAVFSFQNTTPAAAAGSTQPANIYKVTNVQISGLAENAVYDVNNGWESHTGNHTATFGHIVDSNATSETATDAKEILEQQWGKSYNECLLIPGTHNVTISCTITLYNGTATPERVVDVIDYNQTVQLTFAPGVAYNLVLKAGLTESIQFHVEAVDNWNFPYYDVNTPEQGHDNN